MNPLYKCIRTMPLFKRGGVRLGGSVLLQVGSATSKMFWKAWILPCGRRIIEGNGLSFPAKRETHKNDVNFQVIWDIIVNSIPPHCPLGDVTFPSF